MVECREDDGRVFGWLFPDRVGARVGHQARFCGSGGGLRGGLRGGVFVGAGVWEEVEGVERAAKGQDYLGRGVEAGEGVMVGVTGNGGLGCVGYGMELEIPWGEGLGRRSVDMAL